MIKTDWRRCVLCWVDEKGGEKKGGPTSRIVVVAADPAVHAPGLPASDRGKHRGVQRHRWISLSRDAPMPRMHSIRIQTRSSATAELRTRTMLC